MSFLWKPLAPIVPAKAGTQSESAMDPRLRGDARSLLLALAFLFTASCDSPKASAATESEEIDAVSVAPERFKILVENEHVRVIEYALAPGEKDTPHTHPPKVAYVVSGGKLRIHTKNGESFEADEATGAASWDDARGWHYVENIGDTPVRILLVEVKSAANKKGQ